MVHTQVIPYLRELVKGGHELTLLTFEPGEVDEKAVRKMLAAEGIEWHSLRYHKRPSVPATLFDICLGAIFVRRLLRRKRFDILHCRVHHPLAMAVIATRFLARKPKLIFDIRGFLPEEYVDAGVWKDGGLLFRAVKFVERILMARANGFVVLTGKARSLLFPEISAAVAEGGYDVSGRPVEVIPCCVDMRRFSGTRAALRESRREQLGIEDRFVVLHLGALGGLYLVREIADFLATCRESDPSTFALFLTQSSPSLIEGSLRERGFATEDFLITRVPPAEVESYLYASDVGLSIVKATYATASRSPTKIPEYLAGGMPIIVNPGVGDVDKLVETTGCGAILTDFSKESYFTALKEIKIAGISPEYLQDIAHKGFSLENVGGHRYRRLYKLLK